MYLHYTLAPGAEIVQAVPPTHNAFVYVFGGRGLVGRERQAATEGQMALLRTDGDDVRVASPADATAPLELLLIAGLPLGEPIARYGPFVMNTRAEILQAIEDYQAGRLGG
jgi:redox-sensitive bicupin YhaK (pirin superfamily)